MEKPVFCSQCKYAKVEVEENGLIIYCRHPAYKTKPGFNHFSIVKRISAYACARAEFQEEK